MRSNTQETIEHYKVPEHVARELKIAGGVNPYGEPMFRVVWGYDRIVPFTGEWQEWERAVATLTDKETGYSESRPIIRLVRSVVETRHLPKYLPGNCWHLEKWIPTSFTQEEWQKFGEEVVQGLTVDTAGPYPERGEYELCYPLTTDGTSHGEPIPLFPEVVAAIVGQLRREREANIPFLQRRAAIEQRERMKEEGFVKRTRDMLKDGLRPFAGETFVSVPQTIEP